MDAPAETNLPRSQPNRRSRALRWRRRLYIYGGLYLLVLLAILMGLSDRLILFPSKQPLPSHGLTRQVTYGPAGKLECWTVRTTSAEPEAFVLSFIGNADRAEHAAERDLEVWSNKSVEIVAVNYPGFGGSEGSARLASIGPAALAAYDELKARAGGRKIFVQGMSIGTTAALHVAANRPVAGMVLQNPPPLRQLIIGRHGWWNLWLIAVPVGLTLPSDLDSLANAKKATAPAVFVLAGDDEVVPPAYQQRVVDAHTGPHQLVRLPGAHHNDLAEGSSLKQLHSQIDWLWQQ